LGPGNIDDDDDDKLLDSEINTSYRQNNTLLKQDVLPSYLARNLIGCSVT